MIPFKAKSTTAKSGGDRTAPPVEDRELVQRLLAGEQAAFDQFFTDSFDRLYRFAIRRVDGDENLALEVVQGTLCKAIEKLETFRGEAALFTWLCSICRFEIAAHFRRRQRAPVALDPNEDDPEIRSVLAALAAEGESPEDLALGGETIRLVHRTLDHLPPRYGRALEWKYLDGLSVSEIADQLGVGTKAAESILTRARDAFRRGFTALGRELTGAGSRPLARVGTTRSLG